jgi:predicted GNAT family acetyltransferase
MYQGLTLENGRVKGFKPGVDLYCYFNNEKLLGILMFLPNNALIPHIIDENIVKKYDLLKLLKDKNPDVIKGDDHSIDILSKIIQTFTSDIKEEKCTLYECVELEASYVKGGDVLKKFKVDNDYNKNYNNIKEFLIEYEKSFGKNPISINEQRKKISNSFEKRNHLLMSDDNRVIGRAAIDFFSQRSNVISGIYISEGYRDLGIGKKLTYEITKLALADSKNAMLTVLNENEKAIKIYTELGYKKLKDYKIITKV